MKNTIQKGRITFLILGNENKFLGICREFGFIEEGKTYDEVYKKLDNGSRLLLETVVKNPRLEPSLNVAPPFKYLLIYYGVLFFGFIAKLYYECVSFRSSTNFGYA